MRGRRLAGRMRAEVKDALGVAPGWLVALPLVIGHPAGATQRPGRRPAMIPPGGGRLDRDCQAAASSSPVPSPVLGPHDIAVQRFQHREHVLQTIPLISTRRRTAIACGLTVLASLALAPVAGATLVYTTGRFPSSPPKLPQPEWVWAAQNDGSATHRLARAAFRTSPPTASWWRMTPSPTGSPGSRSYPLPAAIRVS